MLKIMPPLPREQRTLYKLLKSASETWGTAPALQQPIGNGQYKTYTWVDYRQIAEEIAAGLRTLGITVGTITAIASETRAEFYLADFGAITCGCISAAVYTSLTPAEQVRSLKNCDPKVVFVENPKTMKALLDSGGRELEVTWILLSGEDGETLTLDRLRSLGQKAIVEDSWLLSKFETEVGPENYCILYLTSGATGEPKMGLVTHNAVVANTDMGQYAIPTIRNEDSTIAFLPSAHITQRLVCQMLMLRHGTEVWFSEGLTKLAKELQSIRPTFFIAPPRVWEKMYSSIGTEIRKKPAPLRKLIYLGIGVGSEAARARARGKEPSPLVKSSLAFFDRIVFSKIRARLGGRIKIAISGSAPLGKDLGEFYSAIGLPLVEGYGLTEGGVTHVNPVERPKAGTIGKIFPGIEGRIAEDGELLLKSEVIFSGYYKDPEATAAVLKDGWLHTGDIATIDEDGYYYITGRKKELIVSSNGKKIYPARIEALFKLEPIVNQVLLIGDKLPYMTAILTLNPQAAEQVKSATGKTVEELAADPAVEAELKRAVARINKQLAPFEQIRKFKILPREFSLETGELTPTMKLRRTKVLENLRQEVNELYVGRDEVPV